MYPFGYGYPPQPPQQSGVVYVPMPDGGKGKKDPFRDLRRMNKFLESQEIIRKKKEEERKDKNIKENPLVCKRFSLLQLFLIITGLFPLYGWPVYYAWKTTFELFTK